MTFIHPTAIIEDGAEIGEACEIGAYCVIGSHVKLDSKVKLHSHVVVTGHTSIGEGTEIFPFSAIGKIPQDLKFEGEEARLEIGKYNRIREHVTMNIGTKGGGMLTKIGDHGLFMAGSHIAHDSKIGNHVIFVNNSAVAGHCEVDDFAIIGGLSAIHQFVRIGRHAIVGGMTGVEKDVIPFGSVTGNRASLVGLNFTGLKRRGFDRETIATMRKAYDMLFTEEAGNLETRTQHVAQHFSDSSEIQLIVNFIQAEASRGICMPAQDLK